VPTVGERAAAVVEDYADLAIDLAGRVEVRGEQTRNARCAQGIAFDPVANCRSGFEPLFDFQASLRSGGVIAERVNVNVDYDSQREFESSNTISIAYSGRNRELLERFEIGNVTFQPPRSQFITAGIPSNNTGVQAIARWGPLRIRGIMAQQKGHVVRDRTFTIGDRTLTAIDRAIEDYQFEPRRFFFTVDPKTLSGYPNIDLLDPALMQRVAVALPDTLRPSRLYVYRLLIGGQPPNPSGPQFRILGDPRSRRGPVYEYLREGVDYYADPSLLWIALVRPLAINNERLVVAYRVRVNGIDTVHVSTGGTPDLTFTAEREQFANLLWDPHVKPGDAAFDREIRSIYRVGGSDIVRNSLSVKVVTGPNEDQEKPLTGEAETYLQLFGLAQPTNSSSFDVENRLWPRPTDPNLQVSFGGAPGRTIRDRFLFFPSLRPFATAGLTRGNPSNDPVYSTPGEHFNTPRRPPTVYHLRVRYQAIGSGDGGAVLLGSVQLRPNSERITVDGVPLVRGVDYTIDYELGRVSFTRVDSLFQRPRQVIVHYEENPLFADTPTSIAGGTAELILEKGEVAITALSQTQKTTFNRPPLGFEPASALIGGVSGSFSFDADPLRRLVSMLPWGETSVPARISLSGEFAVSSPKPNKAGQAYLESFEGEGGLPVPLEDRLWYYSSQPALGRELALRFGANVLQLERASTLAWQSSGLDTNSRVVAYSIAQIDPQTQLFGVGVTAPEPLLWLTLYPLGIRGLLDEDTRTYRWRAPTAVAGRRWRSIRTQLGPSGTDLTRAENLEFWVQIPVAAVARAKSPVLVFDFGDISENTVAFAPDSAMVRRNPNTGAIDTLFNGSRIAGVDRLDSERDPFSRAFNVTVNDRGLPGDLLDSLTVVTDTSGSLDITTERDFALCSGARRVVHLIGDNRANCTVRNSRLDEEDLDADNVLNLTASESNAEEWRRYVVDLATTPFVRREADLPVHVRQAGLDGAPDDRNLRAGRSDSTGPVAVAAAHSRWNDPRTRCHR
jgi:cell surface protein SprA